MRVPEVSVVIPTHGRPALLRTAVVSVLRQRGVEVELFVVDDGSPEDLDRHVPELANGRVHVLRSDHSLGVSRARNRGVASAAGRWIAFLDDDDLWGPNKLAMQLSACRASGALWSICGVASIGTDGELLSAGGPPSGAQVVRELPYRNPIPAGASNVIVRRDVLEEAPFDQGLRHLADWDLWIRLAHHGEPAVVEDLLVACRVHPGNQSLDHSDVLAETAIIDQRYAKLRGRRPVDWAYVHRWIAWNCLRVGDRRGALISYARAVRTGDFRSVLRAIVGGSYPAVTRRQPAAGIVSSPSWLTDLARLDEPKTELSEMSGAW